MGHSKCHEKNIVVVLFEAKRGFNKITSWSRAVPSPELEVLVDRVREMSSEISGGTFE